MCPKMPKITECKGGNSSREIPRYSVIVRACAMGRTLLFTNGRFRPEHDIRTDKKRPRRSETSSVSVDKT
jgi:hypothetical protein